MMKLVSMLGNWLMERFIREKIPKMAMATNTKAVVTGLLTAVLCKLIVLYYFTVTLTPSFKRICPSVTILSPSFRPLTIS